MNWKWASWIHIIYGHWCPLGTREIEVSFESSPQAMIQSVEEISTHSLTSLLVFITAVFVDISKKSL
jgi:hypothetical protein